MLPKGMTVSQLLFSTQGRIPRSTLWLRFMIPACVLSFGAVAADIAAGSFDEDAGIGLFSGLYSLVLFYPSIAVCVKRFHDRDRSGWFYLVFFVPILNIWPAVELYFLRGSPGENKYGPDPLITHAGSD